MNHVIAFVMLFMLAAPIVVAEDMRMKRFSLLYEDPRPMDGLLVRVSLESLSENDIEDVRVTISLPEIGVYRTFGPRDIDPGLSAGMLYYIPLPDDVKPGEYILRTVVQNQDNRIVRHRFVEIRKSSYCWSC